MTGLLRIRRFRCDAGKRGTPTQGKQCNKREDAHDVLLFGRLAMVVTRPWREFLDHRNGFDKAGDQPLSQCEARDQPEFKFRCEGDAQEAS